MNKCNLQNIDVDRYVVFTLDDDITNWEKISKVKAFLVDNKKIIGELKCDLRQETERFLDFISDCPLLYGSSPKNTKQAWQKLKNWLNKELENIFIDLYSKMKEAYELDESGLITEYHTPRKTVAYYRGSRHPLSHLYDDYQDKFNENNHKETDQTLIWVYMTIDDYEIAKAICRGLK